MSTFPVSPRSSFLQWCGLHAPIFAADPAAIGLAAGQASGFTSLTQQAAEAQSDYRALLQQAESARLRAEGCVAELRAAAGDCVRSIRAFAEVAPSPLEVYTRASIEPPAPPSPMPAPQQPHGLSARLDSNSGFVTLRWRCAHPRGASGTTYLLRRRLPGETGWRLIGTTGRKQFTDDGLPPGPWVGPSGPGNSVQYTVQGQRGRRSGAESNMLTVLLGPPPAAVVTTKAVETPKATTGGNGPPSATGGSAQRRPAANAAALQPT